MRLMELLFPGINRARYKETEEINFALRGQIEVLKDWNEHLRGEVEQYKNIIFHKYGLINPVEPSMPSELGPIPQTETWRTAKKKLEDAHKTPPELSAVQKYWDDKLKKQEEEQKTSAQQ